MIPTTYKSKLPKSLSYPIGAQDVRDGLKGVPQESELSLGFYDRPTIFASEFQKLRSSKSPYPIMSASFRNVQPGLTGSNQHIAEGYYQENWEISVYPVLREHRSIAKQALLADGLPQIRNWLSIKRSSSWRQGRRTCEILFVESEAKLILRETAAA